MKILILSKPFLIDKLAFHVSSNGMCVLFVFFLSPFLFTVASSLSNLPIVQTSYGAVRGYEYRAKNGFVAEIFKKIPYAAAPIGLRRWKKPEPPVPWNYTLDGTFYGPACAQVPSTYKGGVTGFSEDCLTLNIYTSKNCIESNASCPVVLYVHGGGDIFSGVISFADEIPVRNFPTQGVIFITMSYRLGPFGVMALGDEDVLPANLAMHDVLESLRFVRREIHAFGGDKNQITLMGQSSAATMVLAFVFSPAISKPGEPPLFAGVIAFSGTAAYESEEKQVDMSHRVASKLGCAGTAREIIDCMMNRNTAEIIRATVDASGGSSKMSGSQLSGITLAGELMPIHNSKELREQQKEHMSRLSQPTKLVIGTTLYEFDVVDGIPEDARVQALDVLGVRNIEECREKYFRDVEAGDFTPGYDTTSQSLFLATALFAQAQSRAGGEVHVYQYDYPVHAQHADDALYVVGIADHPMDENERWLSRVYPLFFTNFIKGLPLAPDWSPLDPSLMNYYSVNKSLTDGVVPRMKLGYQRNIYEYFNKMMEFDEKITAAKTQDPVQMRSLTLESFTFLTILIFFAVLFFSVLFIVQCIRCCRSGRATSDERSPLI